MNKIIDIVMINDSTASTLLTEQQKQLLEKVFKPFETKIIKSDSCKFYIIADVSADEMALIPDWATIITASTDGLNVKAHMQRVDEYSPQVREMAIKQPVKNAVVSLYSDGEFKTSASFSHFNFLIADFKNEILLNLALNPKTRNESGISILNFTLEKGGSYLTVTDGRKVYIIEGETNDPAGLKVTAITNFFKDECSSPMPTAMRAKLTRLAIQNHQNRTTSSVSPSVECPVETKTSVQEIKLIAFTEDSISEGIGVKYEEYKVPNCDGGSTDFYNLGSKICEVSWDEIEMEVTIVTDGTRATGVFRDFEFLDLSEELVKATFNGTRDIALANYGLGKFEGKIVDLDGGNVLRLEDILIEYAKNSVSTDEKGEEDGEKVEEREENVDNTFQSFLVTRTPNYDLEYVLLNDKNGENDKYIYDLSKATEKHQRNYRAFVSFVVMRKGDKIVGVDCREWGADRTPKTHKFLTENFNKVSHGEFYCLGEEKFIPKATETGGKILKHIVGERTELLSPYFDKQVKISQLPDIKQSGSCFVLKNDHGTGIFLTDEELKTVYCVEIEGKEVMHNGVPKEVLRKFNHSAQLSLTGYALDNKGVYIIPIEKIIRHVPKIEVGEYGGYYSV